MLFFTEQVSPNLKTFKEPRNGFQGIDSAILCTTHGPVRQIRLSHRPARLGIDSWAPFKIRARNSGCLLPHRSVTFSFHPKILIHTKTGRGKRQNQKRLPSPK
jgi:hypothetical protein